MREQIFNSSTDPKRTYLRSANAIDKSLVDTKGQTFVARMKATLPRLDAADDVREQEVTNQDDKAIVKICEYDSIY